MKLLGMAPAVPIAMKISNLSADIVDPHVIQETDSGIVIANHMPGSVIQKIDTMNESVISYSISEHVDSANWTYLSDETFRTPRQSFPQREIQIKIYGKEDSKLAQVQLNDRIVLEMRLDRDEHQPGIYESYNVICTDKRVDACVDQFFTCDFTFSGVGA
jgi:hypothetical protein